MNVHKCFHNLSENCSKLFAVVGKHKIITRSNCYLINRRSLFSRFDTPVIFTNVQTRRISSAPCPDTEPAVKFDDISFEQPVTHEDLLSALLKCGSIAEQMETLASTLSLPPDDIKKRVKFCKNLESLFKPFFLDFKIQIFGSTANGFGFKGCDMDMTFETSSMLNNKNCIELPDIPLVSEVLSGKVSLQEIADMPIKDQLHFMHGVLLEYYRESEDAPIFINAHVPLLRFRYDKSNLKCDLTFKNRVAFANTKLLYLFTKLDKRVIPFMMTVRYWAKHAEIIGKGLMFNTYTISLLAIYFLQSRNPPILPSAEYITSFSSSFESEDMNDRSFLEIIEKISPSKNNESLDDLLKDFFHFYLFFDFTRVICPLIASSVPRDDFFTTDRSKKFKLNTLCVQDPMCPDHNVADLVDFKACKKLSSSLLNACEVLHDPRTSRPSLEPWGIMNIFNPPAEYSIHTISKRRSVSFRVPFVSSAEDISSREKASRTAVAVRKVLQRALLFECKEIEEKVVLELLEEQDKYFSTKQRHFAVKNELITAKIKRNNPDLVIPDENTGPSVSMLEEFKTMSSERELFLWFECKALKNTWLGRNCVNTEKFSGINSMDILSRERLISEQTAKQNSEIFAEKIKPIIFLCEFYLPKDSSDSAITIVVRSLQKFPFSPVLCIFLRRYLISITSNFTSDP